MPVLQEGQKQFISRMEQELFSHIDIQYKETK